MHVTQSPVMLVPLIMSLYAWEPLGILLGVILIRLDYDAFFPMTTVFEVLRCLNQFNGWSRLIYLVLTVPRNRSIPMGYLVQIQEQKGILASLISPLAASGLRRNLNNGFKSLISKSFIPMWPSELERRQYQTEHQDQEKHAALSCKPTE